MSLPADQIPWLEVANQVLRGDWKDPDDSTRESLTIGLRWIDHPDCRLALARLDKPKKPRKQAENQPE